MVTVTDSELQDTFEFASVNGPFETAAFVNLATGTFPLPDDYDKVADSFHKRGAYGRFKDLLDRRSVREAWYAFEAEATELALKQWCEEHGIQLSFAKPAA